MSYQKKKVEINFNLEISCIYCYSEVGIYSGEVNLLWGGNVGKLLWGVLE
ncbi:MAG TPA: hypothetical protein PLB63_08890 [Planctomycetota bacterium]|nr:hypothetical protein [Planctomycetota bacterium]HQB00348.1 hypothetical protein [Planctomycetota bacterium]